MNADKSEQNPTIKTPSFRIVRQTNPYIFLIIRNLYSSVPDINVQDTISEIAIAFIYLSCYSEKQHKLRLGLGWQLAIHTFNQSGEGNISGLYLYPLAIYLGDGYDTNYFMYSFFGVFVLTLVESVGVSFKTPDIEGLSIWAVKFDSAWIRRVQSIHFQFYWGWKE